jgi:predicted DNA-binding transcriptional regulator AlpA
VKLSDQVSLDLIPRSWVYRLWNENGDCLYVGQHTGIYPATRVQSHRSQPWWNEVTGADYVEVLEGELDIADKQQIHDLNARYNDGGWERLHPPVTIDGAGVEADFLSVKDVARLLGRHPRTLREWRVKGRGPLAVRLGGLWAYPRSDFDTYLQSLTAETAGQPARIEAEGAMP